MTTHILKSIPLSLVLVLGTGCSSTRDTDRPTAKDASGNYATTSKFNAAYRAEFVNSIRAGLEDADRRTKELESRATQLGQASVTALHEQMPGLVEKRTAVVNSIARLEAALDTEWPSRREETDEAYRTLRSSLDSACAKVLDK